MSELTDVIDCLTGELERFRDLHAETLIEHAKERDRWAAGIIRLRAELQRENERLREKIRDIEHATSVDYDELANENERLKKELWR